MVDRKGAAIVALLAFLAGAVAAHAQDLGEFSLEMLADGTPRFTQVLRWDPDANVLSYEVTVQTGAGEEVGTWKLQEPMLELNLKPGAYRYRVVLYNLLGKPEVELPWRSIEVRKAEVPRLSASSPKVWFIDDLKAELTLSGENLDPGATVELRPAAGGAGPIAGTELEREANATLRVGFPEKDVKPGDYAVVVVNPGGITATLPGALTVRYERPVDVLVAGGYGPWFSLYDPWYVQAWPGMFFPAGAAARVSVYFVKTPFGQIGAEVAAAGRLMWGGLDTAVISSQVGLLGLNGTYRYLFSRLISAEARVGGGVSLSHHSIAYGETAGPQLASLDPFVTAGLSVQFHVTKHFFLETGVDWTQVFALGVSEGGIQPALCAGLQY
jgi:hypothetical protein